MTALTLTEFLLARISEDEDLAEQIEANPERPRGPQYVSGVGRVAVVGGGYLLAECEAKRRIVQDIIDNDYYPAAMVTDGLSARVLYYLADVYAGHPDYQQEWRP